MHQSAIFAAWASARCAFNVCLFIFRDCSYIARVVVVIVDVAGIAVDRMDREAGQAC